jgi:hypothetical protein
MLIEIYFMYIYVIMRCLAPVTNIYKANILCYIPRSMHDDGGRQSLIASTVNFAAQQKVDVKYKVRPNIYIL